MTAVLVACAHGAFAQQKLLSIDDIYDPVKKIAFGGHPAAALRWIDDAHYAWPRKTAGGGTEWIRVDASSGDTEPLFDAAKMTAALARLPGIGDADARAAAYDNDLIFDEKYSEALASIDSELYIYNFASDRATRLTYHAGDEDLASFSPDGRLVAFVRDNNLFVADVASGRETALTGDGGDQILNGRLDWVYEEEIYGRGLHRAYWWSPDSLKLAFLRIDDTPVPPYVTVDVIPYDEQVEHWEYPKAGDPNPLVTLGVVKASGGDPIWMDTHKYSATDHLIVGVSWKPDARHVVYQVENRTQTWLDMNVADGATGSSSTLFRETTKAWVSPPDADEQPLWLTDGSFLWLSERTGWKHVFHFSKDGALIKQVTDGRWEVRALHGVDRDNTWVYFSGTERSPIGGDVYRIRLDGSGLRRLSERDGTHAARFNRALTLYIDRWSDAATPPKEALHRNDGSELRVIDDNAVPALADYRLAKPEFLQVKTRDGFAMEAMLIKPPDFDPSRKYPVYQFTYGGPHAPMVKNAWGGDQYMYHQLLAQKGIVVWICDNRTASGKGAESTWPVYKHFGELELRDIEDGLAWLKQQRWVDASRIGIHGWSFGGFMTSYALTHSTTFTMGISGGTVSDWRNYDTVYTERYMGLPQDNPDGYRNSSPRWSARDLHGDLLLIHGAVDDNVHPANTLQFAYELQQAGKPFRLMLYPKSRHAVSDPLLVKHLREMMLDYTLEHLKPGEPRPAGTTGR